MLHIAVFLSHHVHMGLQDDTLMLFVTRRSGYAHDDVHRFIGHTLNAMLGCKRLQPTTDLFLMFRRTGHFANFRKDIKNCFRFHNNLKFCAKIVKNLHICKKSSNFAAKY